MKNNDAVVTTTGALAIAPDASAEPQEIYVPFKQLDLYRVAQKEEAEWMNTARYKRWRMRALVLMFAGIVIGLMLYNANSNRSAMLRAGQTSNVVKSDAMLEKDPEYIAAKNKFAVKERTIAPLEAEYNRKLEIYKAQGQEGRATAWINKLEGLNAERARAHAEFDSVQAVCKARATTAVTVAGEHVFHELLAYALPVLVLLCSLGAERFKEESIGSMLFAATFLLQIPNAYLVMCAMAHAFPASGFMLPVLGETSPFAIVVGFAVMLGEPLAYYVACRFIREYLESWHDALQHVVEQRAQRVDLRAQIRSDLAAARTHAIDTQAALLAKELELRSTGEQIKARLAVATVAAEREATAQLEERKADDMMPKAITTTQLARILLQMKKDGTYDALLKKFTLAEIAAANKLNAGTLRAAMSNLQSAQRNANESQLFIAQATQEVENE